MCFNVYDVFYSLNSHQHVSAAIAVIFRVMLLQEYNSGHLEGDVIQMQEYKGMFVFL